ncbi:MAG: GTP cyclohydrolase MptA [Chloroflexota bacterium]
MGTTVYIALGANLGDRRANLIDALSQLRHKVEIEQLSGIYETPPVYITDQPRFLNAVLKGTTSLTPRELLRFVKSIERRMGRHRTVRYGPRPIDLDILLYGDQTVDEPDLIIPHPRMLERGFVLIPLADLAPDLRLPGTDEPVAKLAHRPDDAQAIRRVERGLTLQLTHDVQEEAPSAHISLTHVGVSGIERVVRLAGKQRDELFYAEMDIYVELRPDQKGVHMSRFNDTVEEVIGDVSTERVPGLETLAERIAHEVLRDQAAVRSDVHVRAHFPQERHAPVSGKLTQEIYKLIGIAAANEQRVVHLVGVEAEGMMACPCAQDMVANQAREQLLEMGFSAEDADRALSVIPVATHNQRGRGTLLVGTDTMVQAEDLVNIVEGAMSSENYDLLKRPDELFVVAKAHRRPRFVEDAVREMLYTLLELYPDLSDDTFALARQVNMETIHKHDVYAERGGTLGELRREFNGAGYVTPHTSLDRWLRQQLEA